MFFIRADGNSDIGMGHIMRCLAIADALSKQGVSPVFLTAADECIPIINARGYRAELIEDPVQISGDDREDSLLGELPRLAAFLKDSKAVVLVDSYRVTEEYLEELGKFAQVAYLEDMGYAYPVDLLINYNIYGPKYGPVYEEKAQACLLGPAYMPLRGEFLQESAYEVAEQVRDVMITTGGTDPYLAAKAFAEAFLSVEKEIDADLRLHIVSGPFNKRVDELKEAFRKNEKVFIYENIKSMRRLMCGCDVVLTASGSTIYEVSSLGVPMISFYFAENQRLGGEELEKITGVVNCGDFSKDAHSCTEKAAEALRRFVEDREYRREISRREKLLVDGRGAERIAAALIRLGERIR